jgi:hypothetical protein
MRTATVTTVIDAPRDAVFSFLVQGPGMPDALFESQHASLVREFRNIEEHFQS